MPDGIINLGQVAFVDKGTYSDTVTYKRFHFVVTDDSCYLSLKEDNTGHPVSDPEWWRCIANGKQATEAARKALDAAGRAIEAASLANSGAVRAGSAAGLAEQRAGEARQAKEDVLSVLSDVVEMLARGEAQIDSMKAAELSLMSQALLAPSRMELKYTQVVCIRNKVQQRIQALLFPSYVLQNVIFQQPPRFGDAVYVEPDGRLTLNKPGKAKIYVIPTHNTSIWEMAEITVRNPVMRLLGNGKIRLGMDGKIRLI